MLFALNVCQNKMTKKKQNKELFRQRIDEMNNNYIEIISEGSISFGFFYGVEILPNESNLYYKAQLDSFKVMENTLSFVLTKFKFSNKPFSDDNNNVSSSPIEKNIPLLLKFPINYFGNRLNDTLNLNRISSVYDSKSDTAIFVKVKNIKGF